MPLTEYNFNEENAVDRIFYGRIVVKKAASFLFYHEKGVVKNLIQHLKYRNQPGIGSFLGHWWGQILSDNGKQGFVDCVVPVPLHPAKERSRGYNQVDLFGESLALHLQAPYLKSALIKTSRSTTQTKKNRWYRLQDGRQLYALSDPLVLEGKRILLVDDVITTGATIEACISALQKARGVSVYVGTMAFVP